MRKIGTLSISRQAERFGQYLTSQGIQNRVDKAGNDWEIWVFDEEQLSRCREELAAFQKDPAAARYTVKVPPPAPAKAPVRQPSRRIAHGSGRMQITVIVTALCMAITLGTNYGKQPALTGDFMFAPPGGDLTSIMHGEAWRLITPIFLHFSLIHLGFNIYMFWIMGGVIERVRGSGSLLMLILFLALASNSVQYAWNGGAFGGLSGVVYGLFGFLWMRSVYLPEEGFYMPQSLVVQMIAWAILGLTGAIGGIANGAHFGGLLAGMAVGAAPRLWRKF